MSWIELAKKYLEDDMTRVQEAAWGGLIVKPKDLSGFTSLIMARRLQYSFDRRIEIVGVRDIPTNDFNSGRLNVLLKRMLEAASELELRGIVRKKIKLTEWSELKHLTNLFGSLGRRDEILKIVATDENLLKKLLEAELEILEIFPRLFPSHYLEPYLVLGGSKISSDLVSQYLEHPDGLSWILRAHAMYGTPTLGKTIKKNYVLVFDLSEKLKNLTLGLSSP